MTLRTIKNTLLAATCVAACTCAASANAGAFQNGSFEQSSFAPGAVGNFATLAAGSTAITGWTVTGGGIDYINTYWNAADGAYSLDLSALSAGGVEQTFDTVLGQAYLVDFFLAGNPDGGLGVRSEVTSATGGLNQTNLFVVAGGNTRANMGWTRYSYSFTATGASTTLSFASNENNPYGPALDNVSVTAAGVPEPASWALMMVGFGGLGAVLRSRRRAAAQGA